MPEGQQPHPSEPLGVALMKGLTKALLDNTAAQQRLLSAQQELAGEIRLLRDDLEAVGGLTEDLCGHLTTALRVADHVSIVGAEKAPTWKDVQEVLQEVKDELQQEGEEEEAEEIEPGQKTG